MRGFTLLEIIIYISLLSFMLMSSNIILYSYVETTQKIEEGMKIEKIGMVILQKLQHDILTHKDIEEPFISDTMPISHFSVTHTSLQAPFKKTEIEFYIQDHFFTLTSYEQ